jgi:hypothetical protein
MNRDFMVGLDKFDAVVRAKEASNTHRSVIELIPQYPKYSPPT